MTRRDFVSQGTGLLAASIMSNASTARAAVVEMSLLPATTVHRIEADGVSVFYSFQLPTTRFGLSIWAVY